MRVLTKLWQILIVERRNVFAHNYGKSRFLLLMTMMLVMMLLLKVLMILVMMMFVMAMIGKRFHIFT